VNKDVYKSINIDYRQHMTAHARLWSTLQHMLCSSQAQRRREIYFK